MSKVTMPEPVGVTGQMPATSGFTMATFRSVDVPIKTDVYTADQMEAYAAARVREALEEAARICDAQSKEWDSDSLITAKDYAEFCAVSIRKLIK